MNIKNKFSIAYHMIILAIKNSIIHRFSFWLQMLFSIFPIIVNGFLWFTIYQTKEIINGYNMRETLVYIAIANIFYLLLKVDGFGIPSEIRQGDLNKYLVRPIPYLQYRFFDMIGSRFTFVLLNVIPLCVITIVLNFLNIFTFSILLFGILSAILFIFIGLIINFLLDTLIGLCAFWLDQVIFLFIVKEILLWLFSGKLLPLDFAPEGLRKVIMVLPFKFLSYYPTSLFMGKNQFDFIEIIIALGWILGLYILLQIIWKKGIKEYAGYGW